MVFLFAFSYLGANLPIWRYAQPVAYIGFWIMLITILLSAVGMVVAPLLGTKDAAGNLIGAFALPRVIPHGLLDQNIPEYLRRRIEMQDRHLKDIRTTFDDQVLALVPEMERDVTGLAMIEKLATIMFA